MPGSPKALMPRPKPVRRNRFSFLYSLPIGAIGSVLLLVVGFFSLPTILSMDVRLSEAEAPKDTFPISVNPVSKVIIEDPGIEALLEDEPASLTASVGSFEWLFTLLASEVASLPAYTLISGSDQRFVTIHPGYRREEVARAFGRALGWSTAERTAFLKQTNTSPPVVEEGQFQPGTYAVSTMMTSEEVQVMVYDRFAKEILERYPTTTAEQLPLHDALTIASLIEREAGGWHDMRDISGVLWNRIFMGMNLQIDATLQYAKAPDAKGNWWPTPVPDDKYIKSTYNTYRNNGLPPTPIASPSVAAVVAALNPKKTDCIFYFHDARGRFHCSPTYEGHVTLLKKHYGRGK